MELLDEVRYSNTVHRRAMKSGRRGVVTQFKKVKKVVRMEVGDHRRCNFLLLL